VPGQELTGELSYEGVINHAVKESGGEYARAFAQSPGLIESRGVYLAARPLGAAGADALMTYTLAVELPAGWKSVSQASARRVRRTLVGRHADRGGASDCRAIHRIFSRCGRGESDGISAQARSGAGRPLPRRDGAIPRDVSRPVGPYPYSKFALVENFWETGYGMPSFTLLGEQVIRFPFILHSSYPHELLHNWWGNGVFVDFAAGTGARV